MLNWNLNIPLDIILPDDCLSILLLIYRIAYRKYLWGLIFSVKVCSIASHILYLILNIIRHETQKHQLKGTIIFFPFFLPSMVYVYSSLAEILYSCATFTSIWKILLAIVEAFMENHSKCKRSPSAHMEEIVFRSKYLQEIRILIYATIDETKRSACHPGKKGRGSGVKQIDPSNAVPAGHARLPSCRRIPFWGKSEKYICIYAFCMRAFSNCCRSGTKLPHRCTETMTHRLCLYLPHCTFLSPRTCRHPPLHNSNS